VLLEGSGWCEFAQLVANHILSDVHWDEDFAVMNFEINANENRGNCRPARPSLDRLTVTSLLGDLDFSHQGRINEESFFAGA
jgi:hypothetical protein